MFHDFKIALKDNFKEPNLTFNIKKKSYVYRIPVSGRPKSLTLLLHFIIRVQILFYFQEIVTIIEK